MKTRDDMNSLVCEAIGVMKVMIDPYDGGTFEYPRLYASWEGAGRVINVMRARGSSRRIEMGRQQTFVDTWPRESRPHVDPSPSLAQLEPKLCKRCKENEVPRSTAERQVAPGRLYCDPCMPLAKKEAKARANKKKALACKSTRNGL